nr:phosphotransferase [Actinomycetales bacterium]
MFATTSPEFGRALADLARTNPDLLGLSAPADATVRIQGQGESYVAWRLGVPTAALPESVRAAGAEALVVRAPARPVETLPHAATAEFRALELAPPGIGPVPVRLVAVADSPFGVPLLIQSLVPGRVLPDFAWTGELLTAHAHQLAELHSRRYSGHGAIGPDGVTDADLSPVMDPLDFLDGSLQYWERTRPDLLRDTAAGRLSTSARTYVEASRPAFESVPFALLQGDAAPLNILVHEGTPRYIDWEWTSIGDPARDLGLLGAAEGASPWYITLDDRREEHLLRAYLEAGGGAGVDDLERLRTRRRVHEVMEQLFTATHFLSRLHPVGRAVVVDGRVVEPGADTPAVPVPEQKRGIYERAVATMFRAVAARLGDQS